MFQSIKFFNNNLFIMKGFKIICIVLFIPAREVMLPFI